MIRVMWKLSEVEAESAKWAYRSFPIAKQDYSIQLMQDLWPINLQLKKSKHPLPMIEDTIVKIRTFCWVRLI